MRRISLALALLGAVAAAGCGQSSSNGTATDIGSGIKHAYFGDPKVHVAEYMKQCQTPKPSDAFTCTSCHGANLLGGMGPSCSSCHTAPNPSACFAHPTDGSFANPALHGAAWISSSGSCATCHDHGDFAPRCDSCHALPHAPGGYPDHSKPFLAQLDAISATTVMSVVSSSNLAYTVTCTGCHGSGANAWQHQGAAAPGQAPSCGKCHEYPTTGHFQASGHNTGVCSRCHSGDGFRDLIGADGSTVDVLNVQYGSTAAAATQRTSFNSGFRCNACHNGATILGNPTTYLNQHKFASGNVLTLDGKSAICAQCHDGGRPGYEVSQLMAQAPVGVATDAQLVGTKNATVRAHYFPAASTLYGKEAGNWYQYPGMNYTARNQHGGNNACTFCHDAHTGDLPADGTNADQIGGKCGGCHANEAGGTISTLAALQANRQYGFNGDIDGNGVEEDLQTEINGLGATLYQAIQAYAVNVSGTAICNPNPTDNKFYVLTDGNAATCGVAGGPNVAPYNKWTPRLLRAGYNYLMWQQDPGTWAHNPRYVIEVLFDTITDLNAGLGANAVPFSGKRSFEGHFGASDAATPYAAFNHWANFAGSSSACAQCHGGQAGFSAYLAGAPAALSFTTANAPDTISGFQCSTCHTFDGADMKGLRTISTVYFPPQKNGAPTAGQVSFDASSLPTTFALCGSCHSARENKATVDNKGLTAGVFSATLVNPHYLGAAATIMGTRTKSWYEYDGKHYTAYPAFWKDGARGVPGDNTSVTTGKAGHSPHAAECSGCHQPKESRHSFEVQWTYCNGCHTGNYALAPKATEYEDMKTELLAALNLYVSNNLTAFQATTANGAAATGLCYDGSVYGYLLVKTAAGCTTTAAKLDLNSMKAGYNLHWMNKEPGGWAHNEYYVKQLVYDSISDLGFTPSFVITSASSTDATLNRP
jgi:hypothetical protein